MKKLILSAIFAVCTLATTMAQVDEGHVKFNLDVTATDPQMEMAVGMMQGSSVEIYFSGESIHSEINMGAVMKVQTIVLGETGEALILMSGMMGNTAVPTTTEAMEAESVEAPELDIQLVDETKEILGYECKKAIVTDEDGNETITWYSEDIKVNTKGQSYHNEKIPGFPLEFTQSANGMAMAFTATEIESKIDKKKKKTMFSVEIPEGYKEMTPEELKSMGM